MAVDPHLLISGYKVEFFWVSKSILRTTSV
jgi:hypothetical protein